jgi:acyl-ACP thioesterase
MYIEKRIVSSNDIDATLTIRISSLLRIMQDVIMNHTEVLGVGTEETINKGIIWVITRMNIEINRLPKYQEEIVIKTHPGPHKLFFYPRYIRFEDKNGNVLVNISSIWALVDASTRQISNSKIIQERCVGENDNLDLPLPIKIDITDELELKETRKIHYSDVDLNGHLNFTKYVELISDLHNTDFYKNHSVKNIVINYSKEIKEHQEVNIYSNNSKNEQIKITSIEGDHLFAQINYN